MEKFDVYGVCNPLIDLLSHIPDSFLKKNGIEKSIMHLISIEEQQRLLRGLSADKLSVESASGGSGANSMIGIAQLGGRTAFSGKIGRDEHGKIYREKLEDLGVSARLGEGDGSTGSSLILVSDDGCRTMNTYLGMGQELQVPDIDPEVIKVSKYLYLTGYLWDTESQKKAVRAALDEAKRVETKVALSLSDPFCVKRHKEDFKSLLQGYASMVFCNQEEAFTLLQTDVTQEAVDIMSKWTETVVLTLGANGAIISHLGQTYYIDPFPIRVEDTTGAGDAFAAGFLFGMTHEFSPLDSGRIGAVLAGAVIEQTGPRFHGHAHSLIREKLGITL
jgi:sugar/nucleoside kinase (ribokinase family)|tara:strand:- start:474 stop:1472 length:999 start_codon:yes stop_codon:yes gene_type:complete